MSLNGRPMVHAYCHCQDCRDLLKIPVNALAAWDSAVVQVAEGQDQLIPYRYPGKTMKRYACRSCRTTLYNTNVYEWVVVSQSLLHKCRGNNLPGELESDKHFFYEDRILSVDDPLPKYLRGVDGL